MAEFPPAQFFDQSNQRPARVEILLARRRKLQGIDEFRPGVESQKQFFIRQIGAAVLFSHFFECRLGVFYFLDLACPRAI